jgi:hypothetical protein
MASRHRVVFALLLGVAGAGCYKPNVQDGGLRCADAGSDAGLCPDGFYCARDGSCHKGKPMQCAPDGGRVETLCTPTSGTDCDPVCQSRCECGRCNLVGSALQCVPAGDKKTGDICSRTADDCAPGNICIPDCKTIGRCYRFCGTGGVGNDALCAGQPCNYTTPTGNLLICQPPLAPCDPVVDGNDCGHPELGCYLSTSGAPVCDCRGTGAPGGTCETYNSCIPGYRCVQIGTPACYKTCRLSGSDCVAPDTCRSLGGSGAFGFCAP